MAIFEKSNKSSSYFEFINFYFYPDYLNLILKLMLKLVLSKVLNKILMTKSALAYYFLKTFADVQISHLVKISWTLQ